MAKRKIEVKLHRSGFIHVHVDGKAVPFDVQDGNHPNEKKIEFSFCDSDDVKMSTEKEETLAVAE